jgi:hypothetical protein
MQLMVTAMSRTAPPHFPIPQQIRIADESETTEKLSWRTALLLMFLWCMLAWTGIGLFIAELVG